MLSEAACDSDETEHECDDGNEEGCGGDSEELLLGLRIVGVPVDVSHGIATEEKTEGSEDRTSDVDLGDQTDDSEDCQYERDENEVEGTDLWGFAIFIFEFEIDHDIPLL